MKTLHRLILTTIFLSLWIGGFSQIDTSGLSSWTQMYNSTSSWEEGSFGVNALGHPDYGWGVYFSPPSPKAHSVVGDSLFIIKLQDGTFKKLWMVERNAISVYTFRYSDLDGSNEKEVVIDMKLYADKQFVYYNMRGDSLVDEQPLAVDWDLQLNKFWHPGLSYTVTGFLSNDGITVSVFNAADSTLAADATLADTSIFTDSIAAIGNSWYALQGMSIVPLDTIAYFVKTLAGDIYKLQTTYFESGYSGLGRIGIRKQLLDGTPSPAFVHDTLVMGMFYAKEEYYNMKDGSAGHISRDLWDIAFKSGTFTSSIMSNTTMGVELYSYPSGDTADWSPNTSTGPIFSSGSNLRLYPVPAGDYINVSYDIQTQHPVSVRIFDLTGKLIMERSERAIEKGELHLDVSALTEGIYFLQLKNSEIQIAGRFSIRR